MKWLLLIVVAHLVQSCCLVPVRPLPHPPMPRIVPHISPKWGEM